MSINGINPADFGLLSVESMQARDSYEQDVNKKESFQAALERAVADKDKEKLMTACKEFEQYFIQMMYKEMRKTVFRDEKSLIPKNAAEDYFQEMLDEQYSKVSTDQGGIGLAKFLYQQMSGQY